MSKNLILCHANIKGAEQPSHMHISETSLLYLLEWIIFKLP